MGKATETAGDLLTGFTADLDDATLLAQFSRPAGRPGRDPGQRHHPVPLRPRRLPADQRAAAAAAARRLHPGPRDPRLRPGRPPPYPGAPQATRYQYHFSYSDGFGREIQHKAQVAPGPVTDGGPQVSPRWAGSGWTIFDNKGRPVRKYEPFFSATNGFEFAAQTGVSTVLFYDPPGRVVATLHPDNSWEKAVFGPWPGSTGTATTPCSIADPRDRRRRRRTIPAAARHRAVHVLVRAAHRRHVRRDAGGPGRPAGRGAEGGRRCRDARGHPPRRARPGLPGRRRQRRRGPISRPHRLRHRGQAAGRLRRAGPAGGRNTATAIRSPAAGSGTWPAPTWPAVPLYQVNADGGARRGLVNVAGQPIRSWDARGHAFRLVYDPAQRPTRALRQHRRRRGDPHRPVGLRRGPAGGQPVRPRCSATTTWPATRRTARYDYKGNLLASARQLAADYHQAVDWTPLAGLTTAAQLDAAAAAAGLVPAGDGGRDRFARQHDVTTR